MLEGAVMEYIKWFIGLVSIAFICVMVVFMFRLNEVNSFQQEVNYQIERHGGLTDEAKIALNAHTKNAYGGCLAESPEDNAACLIPGEEGPSSGFFVREFVVAADGSMAYKDRSDAEQARYGTKIDYVITRQIGNLSIGGESLLKPSVVGSSSSRVRGNSQ